MECKDGVIDADVAWSVCVCVCVCVSVCLSVCWSHPRASRANAAEPVVMPFGLWNRVGSRNHVLGGGPDPQDERAILG